MEDKSLKFIFQYIALGLKSAMEYRFSFISQTIGMFLNDFAFLSLWWLLFSSVNSIKNWIFEDMLLLLILMGFIWFFLGFLTNLREMGEIIVSGNLDYYLLYPKPILLHLAISKFDYTALGELLFSLVLLPFIHLTLFKLGLILLFSITGVIIISAVTILLNSSVFFFGSTGNFKSLLNSLYAFVVYPSNVYKGLVKFIILFVIPVGFITGVPVDLIKNFDPLFFTLTLIISFSFLTLSIIVFYVGLRRYESGNLLTVRV